MNSLVVRGSSNTITVNKSPLTWFKINLLRWFWFPEEGLGRFASIGGLWILRCSNPRTSGTPDSETQYGPKRVMFLRNPVHDRSALILTSKNNIAYLDRFATLNAWKETQRNNLNRY